MFKSFSNMLGEILEELNLFGKIFLFPWILFGVTLLMILMLAMGLTEEIGSGIKKLVSFLFFKKEVVYEARND
jgi:hypothetical protein